jgi:hypothetical protein
MPDCLPDEENYLTCQNCADAITRARHLDSQARRERVEAVWAEQDARSERDGGYKVQPINFRIPQIGEK